MLLRMKTFETLCVKSNITFFTKLYACFGTIGTAPLPSFDYPMRFIVIANVWDNLSMISWDKEDIR